MMFGEYLCFSESFGGCSAQFCRDVAEFVWRCLFSVYGDSRSETTCNTSIVIARLTVDAAGDFLSFTYIVALNHHCS